MSVETPAAETDMTMPPLELGPGDFAEAFGEPISDYVAGRISERGMRCRRLAPAERDDALLRIVNALAADALVRAGPQRLPQWEEGWGDHLEAITTPFDRKAVVPKYFGKYHLLRWLGDFVRPLSPDFEYDSFATIQDWLFDRYLREAGAIYELGCGTGHNLLRARDVNPTAALWGLDWTQSSSAVIQKLAAVGAIDGLHSRRFDMFDPDRGFRLEPRAAIYTAAALEQLGDRLEPLLDYLLEMQPSVCIHIEPIGELLDPTRLLDAASIHYFRKRNYLWGFLDRVRALRTEGKAVIHLERRTHVGSLFIEGYSALVWSPVRR